MKKLLFLFLIIAGCDSEDPQPKTVYQIAPELATHVDAFYSEAQAYGYTFSQENLIVKTISSGYALSRYSVDHGQRVIEILLLDPSACMELSVFREMAHALMDKPYSDGDEIMNPDTSPCIYVHASGEFENNREAYINQLFQ